MFEFSNLLIEIDLNKKLEEKEFHEESIKQLANDHFYINGEMKSIYLTRIGVNRGQLETEIMWTVENSYGDKLDSIKLDSYSNWHNIENIYSENGNAFLECFENSFIQCIESDSIKRIIENYENELKKEKETLPIVLPVLDYQPTVTKSVKSIATIICGEGHGSGVLLSEKGLILTNYHVIADSDTIKVVFEDGVHKFAHIERISRKSDLALLQLDSTITDIVPLIIESGKSLDLGMDVYAIGSPEKIGLWTNYF